MTRHDLPMSQADRESSAAYLAASELIDGLVRTFRDRYVEWLEDPDLPPPAISTRAKDIDILVRATEGGLRGALQLGSSYLERRAS